MMALTIAVPTTIGIIAATKAPMVANLDRIVGAIRTIATITNVDPLIRVPTSVEGAEESENLFLRLFT
ncbi:hypothetical protein [Methanosarcina barkeri]|uniref:hypothetical protein n=1 Tax=Methanosarcina barkeri TaxID=2208 RepID=UPI001E2FF653|nr:hypothetical protein [Methanosarcina barkeri]